MTAVLASSPGESPPESSRGRASYSLQPWLVGTYAACLATVGIWIPWYWFDEVVTVAAAKKPWPDLYATLSQVDSVHAFYYTLMKLWTTAFGFSEFSTRFPSAICIGLTSVLLVYLGRQMFGNRVGIVAGLVYPLIPVAIWMGVEARSYSASALACTALVVAFQRAAGVPTFDWRRWSMVVIAFVIAVWVFIFSALTVIPLALLLRHGLRRGYLARLLVCACAAVLAVMPLLYETSTQRSQVSWIGSTTLVHLARTSLADQYFRGQYVFALLALTAIVAGIWVTFRRDSPSRRTNLLFLVLWCVIPTVLLGMTDLLMPQGLYLPRYLAFTAPAVAVLMSIAIARLGRAKAILAVAVIAVAALPTLILRTDAMAKSSWQYGAQVITDRAAAGDAWVAFSHTSVLGETYPRFFDDMTLLNDTGPDDSHGLLRHFGGPLRESLTVPPRITRVWYLSDRMSVGDYEGPGLALFENQGFRVIWTSRERVGPDDLTIYLLERDPT